MMWVVLFWQQESDISTPSSYLMGIWEYCKNIKAKELKSGYLACGSLMYHLAAAPMRVRWKSIILNESFTILFDEHHR